MTERAWMTSAFGVRGLGSWSQVTRTMSPTRQSSEISSSGAGRGKMRMEAVPSDRTARRPAEATICPSMTKFVGIGTVASALLNV